MNYRDKIRTNPAPIREGEGGRELRNLPIAPSCRRGKRAAKLERVRANRRGGCVSSVSTTGSIHKAARMARQRAA